MGCTGLTFIAAEGWKLPIYRRSGGRQWDLPFRARGKTVSLSAWWMNSNGLRARRAIIGCRARTKVGWSLPILIFACAAFGQWNTRCVARGGWRSNSQKEPRWWGPAGAWGAIASTATAVGGWESSSGGQGSY